MFRLFIVLILYFFSPLITAQQNKPLRTVHFAGLDWYVRSGQGNPDDNAWQDSSKSVWVDNMNRLHLKLREINGKWYAAEVRSVQPTHYGTHRFYIANRPDLLDKNVVAGIFIYKGHNQEMDIEFSKWRQDDAPNAQFVVQPEKIGNVFRFNLKLQGDYTTHLIDWQPNHIDFESFYGHNFRSPNPNFEIARWSYQQKKLIDDHQYYIHINLWLSKNQPPNNRKDAELILTSIDTPISPITVKNETVYKAVTLYPNQSYDHLFAYVYDAKKVSYALYNFANQLIKKSKVNKNNFEIDFSNLQKGDYKLFIQHDTKKYIYYLQKNY